MYKAKYIYIYIYIIVKEYKEQTKFFCESLNLKFGVQRVYLPRQLPNGFPLKSKFFRLITIVTTSLSCCVWSSGLFGFIISLMNFVWRDESLRTIILKKNLWERNPPLSLHFHCSISRISDEHRGCIIVRTISFQKWLGTINSTPIHSDIWSLFVTIIYCRFQCWLRIICRK